MITDEVWLRYAQQKTDDFRDGISVHCHPYHHWPIWIFGRSLGFPGDDVAAPNQPPANDQSIINPLG